MQPFQKLQTTQCPRGGLANTLKVFRYNSIQRQLSMLNNFDNELQTQTNIGQQYRLRNIPFRRQKQHTFEHKSTKLLKVLMESRSQRNGLVREVTYLPLSPNALVSLLPMGQQPPLKKKNKYSIQSFSPLLQMLTQTTLKDIPTYSSFPTRANSPQMRQGQ